jgi:hypothetical protein
MRSIFTKALLMAAVVALVGATSRASAQGILQANIPFKFTVSGKTHDAGKYECRVLDDDQTLEFTGPAKAGGFVQVMTRLAAPEASLADGRLVFDKVGDTYFLSEMWLPGQDGFLVHAARERHTHHVVKLQKHERKSS